MAGLILLCAVAPAGAATVSIRIEGQSTTLVARKTVTTPTADVHGDGSCPGETLAGAIDVATGGNWDKAPGGFTNTILGENHAFANNDYWAGWINNKYGNGFCAQPVQDGDDVLVLVDTTDNVSFASAVFPLVVGGLPAVVRRGEAVAVTATEYLNYDPSQPPTFGLPGVGNPVPAGGVRVTGGGADATTGPDGRATAIFTQAGTVTVSAVKPVTANGSSFAMRAVPATICVDDGGGSCGGAPPSTPTEGGSPVVSTPSHGSPSHGSPSYRLPEPAILGIVARRRYAAGKGPRDLRGRVSIGSSALEQVSLRLRRRAQGRCSYYKAGVEAFRAASCGTGPWFDLGDRAEWSYLLPARLAAGRYLLTVRARDRAGKASYEAVAFSVQKEARR